MLGVRLRKEAAAPRATPEEMFDTRKSGRGLGKEGGVASASHLELLAPHGLHVALLANGEPVGHGVAPRVVLGPGEVLPLLLHLCDDLEVSALFNSVPGEPWPGDKQSSCVRAANSLCFGERAFLPVAG